MSQTKQKNTTDMSYTRRTEIAQTTKVETTDGTIYFRVNAEYRDDKFHGLYYTKNDARPYTDLGRAYGEYSTERGYKAAIKRYAKGALSVETKNNPHAEAKL